MQRDSKGRFVKKAQFGLKEGFTTSSKLSIKEDPLLKPLLNNLNPISPYTNLSLETPELIKDYHIPTYFNDNYYTINGKKYKVNSAANQAFHVYKTKNPNADLNQWLNSELSKDYLEEISAGINVFNNDSQNNTTFSLNKEKLANYLEYAKGAIGLGINNKIAKRAIDAEKPFLQTTSESNRSVYGDYNALQQGEKSAAELRKMVSKPLTSDGSLQQDARLKAEIEAQKSIAQGLEADNQRIRQTQEIAWQQEKENQLQRNAVANANRQAMLMSEKNKSNILNMRDSANFSQIIHPILTAKEQRLRDEATKQEYYQNKFDEAYVSQDIWNNMDESQLTPEQKEMRNIYLSQGSQGLNTYFIEHPEQRGQWAILNQEVEKQVLQRLAELKGVTINSLNNNSLLNWEKRYNTGNIYSNKKGGTIYKARLTKRTKDKDRTAKSIASNKKIAARFLEKAIDSLYTYKDVELIAKRKYQAGGGLPFVGVTPVFSSSETGVPKETKEERPTKKESGDLTSKDILELLKGMEGLPVDIDAIQYYLSNFSLEDELDPLGLASSSNIASRYIGLISKIKEAQFHRNEYNVAYNHLVKTGGLDEYAITQDGFLIGRNTEGDYKHFTAEEVAKNKAYEQGYQILTNSNLLYIRQNDPAANFNRGILTVAKNGIGMNTIADLINQAIGNLGSAEKSQEGYVDTKHGQLIQGLEDFVKAMQQSNGNFDLTVQDLYKYKYLTKSQAEQAQKALAYVYQTLPKSAKVLLKSKSDGTNEGAITLVGTLISSKTNSTEHFDIDLVKDLEDLNKGKTSSGSKDNSDLETSLPLNVLKNVGGIDSYVDIDKGDGIHMSVRGTQFNLIKTPNGEPISDTSLSNMLQQSGLQSIVKDMRNIQFGDQRISPEALSFITYNNTGITRADLPINTDGSVNLDLLEAYENAERDLDLSTDKSPEHIRQVYEQYGITSLLNADGTYNQSKFAPFMITEGYTTDALSGLKSSDFVVEYKGNEDSAIALMQKSLAVGTGKNTQIPDVDTFSWYNPGDWFGWTDTIFKGVVYIPITNNVNTAVFGANQKLDYDEALIQEEKYQNFEKMTQQRSTSADLLNI